MHPLLASCAASLLAALALTGCGETSDSAETAPSLPTLPATLAEELARTSEATAASLEEGDACAAAAHAAELRDAALLAVDEGRVPASLEQELLSAVDRLTTQTASLCEPVAPEDDEDEDEGDEDDEDENEPPGKAKGHDKDKGPDEEETTTTTETTPTETDEDEG